MTVEDLTVADLLAWFDAEERWRPVPGWPYEVSSHGQVRRGGTILLPGWSHGYAHVTLSDGDRRETARVHHLVAAAFLGRPPFEGAEVAHNDGQSGHNHAANMRWTNSLDNQADVERHGNRVRGSRVFGAKLVESDIAEIRGRLARGERYPTIARDYNVSVSTISLISLGKIWKHTQGEEAA